MLRNYYFQDGRLEPDCGVKPCKIGSSKCHRCEHCVTIDSKRQQVVCLHGTPGYTKIPVSELIVGDRFKTVKNPDGTLYVVRKIVNGKVFVEPNPTGAITLLKTVSEVFFVPNMW